jgi:hypothetical protein
VAAGRPASVQRRTTPAPPSARRDSSFRGLRSTGRAVAPGLGPRKQLGMTAFWLFASPLAGEAALLGSTDLTDCLGSATHGGCAGMRMQTILVGGSVLILLWAGGGESNDTSTCAEAQGRFGARHPRSRSTRGRTPLAGRLLGRVGKSHRATRRLRPGSTLSPRSPSGALEPWEAWAP